MDHSRCAVVDVSTRPHLLVDDAVIQQLSQLGRWRNNLRRKLLVLVVFVFVDLDGWAIQLVLLIRGVSDVSSRQRLCHQVEVS